MARYQTPFTTGEVYWKAPCGSTSFQAVRKREATMLGVGKELARMTSAGIE
jgi:hypothetical protein